MITKEDYDNKEAIEKDKDDFISWTLINGFDIEDVNEFMAEHYENLKSYTYNVNKMRKLLNDTL